jgi:cellulose synthase/poly-beta-1,6-N-acetylglucosamine synthase-like glycosyltransferase
MRMILFIGIVLLFFALIPYLVFLFGIRFGRKPADTRFPAVFPKISMIISAYNEERVIEERIANLMQCHIPKESWELIFVDDYSGDNTLSRAKTGLEKSGIDYTIIANRERMGTSRSYNNAINLAKNPIIITTDADVFFEPDAIWYLIGRLESDKTIAAVCGELRPRQNGNKTTQLEAAYRTYYGRMCDWESAVDSTYNFNGALVAFRSDLIRRIDDKRGADDANTAFEAIRKEYRAVYESRAIVYEDIPPHFSEQYRQKIRRAKQLIDATLANRDLLGMDRPFSRVFYPLRFFMYLVTPVLTFISLALIVVGLYFVYPLLLLVLLILISVAGIVWRQNLLNAFLINQFYLLTGLLNMGKDMRIWESTSKKV